MIESSTTVGANLPGRQPRPVSAPRAAHVRRNFRGIA